jgi:phosphinothricin acetyltransferase
MEYSIYPMTFEDREAVMDIFNYYVENSFAAYPENKLPDDAFDMFLTLSEGFPRGTIKDRNGKIVGFGMLRAHNPAPTFSQTAEATYFIHPDHTGKGVGRRLLDYLENGAARKGIGNILAHISSLNPNSIKFHRKNGFVECGRFRNVGRKKGREFDTVWMQKLIGAPLYAGQAGPETPCGSGFSSGRGDRGGRGHGTSGRGHPDPC